LQGVKKLAAKGKLIVLKSDDLNSLNSFDQPTKVAPVESAVRSLKEKISFL
jgi:alpha-L-arabinofuranosidase